MAKRIFNSVGSNYKLGFVFRTLFACGGKKKSEDLIMYLNKRYGGLTTLFYKGRNAIEYALLSARLPKGGKVIISGYTCAVVPTAIRNAGFSPLYADITSSSLDFSFEEFKRLCDANPDVCAVVIQNTLGFTNSIKEIEEYCNQKKIVLIEDLAHSAGAKYPDGREAGTVGDFVVLSFSQDKIVDTISGGALVVRTDNFDFPKSNWQKVPFRARLRDRFYPSLTYKVRLTYSIGYGKFLHYLFLKFKMLSLPIYSLEKSGYEVLPNWYAGIILYRLKNLDAEIERRRMCMREYLEMLPSELHPAVTSENIERASCLRVPLLVDDRDGLVTYMSENGIYISDVWYDVPVSPKRYWQIFVNEDKCENAMLVSKSMINFPTHMTMRSKDIVRVAEELQKWKKSLSTK